MLRFVVRLMVILGGMSTLVLTVMTALPRGGEAIPPSDWLLFSRYEANSAQSIPLLMRFDGRFSHALEFPSSITSSPQWSPDGQWITAIGPDLQGKCHIYRMHSNEGVLESILINGIDGFCWQESWSPDGQWILFYGSDHRLYRVRPDGSDFQSIAASLTSIFNVTWSPDSHWLIFQREDSIYRMRPDGTERRRIATGTILYNDETWSPDSEWLVIAKNDAMAGMQPYLLRSDGSDLNLLSDYRIIGSPAWSPDGEWIIFEISENLRYEVYRIRPDGSNLQQITHLSGRETILSWSPDSQWIMLNMDHGTRSIQLGRVRANGGDLHSFPYSAMSGVFWGPSVDIPYRPGIALILGGGMVIIGVALSKRA